jgi:hypothetical protein
MAASYLTISFLNEHSYTWTGILNNEEVKNKEKSISKIKGTINSISKELLIGEIMLGQLVLIMPRYDIKINYNDIIKTDGLLIDIQNDKLNISGTVIAKVSLKPDALAMLKEKTINAYIANVNIWRPEDDMTRNSYRYAVYGDWKSIMKHQELILANGVDENSFKITISDKKPK